MTQTAATKVTADLVPGDRIRYQTARTAKNILLPFSETHPGEVITVLGVEPWILTAGPYAGQQAAPGRRGNTGAPLFHIVISDEDAARIEGRPVGRADWPWTLA